MKSNLCHIKYSHAVAARAFLFAISLLMIPNNRQALTADEKQASKAESQEVIIDVVARDKKGNPVTDLKEQDVEISEDGVKQKITSMRLAAADHSAGARTSSDPLQNVKVVTMVFQNQFTSPDGQSIARKAVNEFLKLYPGEDTVVGMFTIDKRFCVVQQYTNHKEYLSEALDKAIAQDTEPLRRSSEAIQKNVAAIASGSAVQQPDHALGGTGDARRDAALAQITTKIINEADANANDQGGWRTVLFSLQAVANQLRVVPGRKTMLYFAWGLWIPRENLDQVSQLESTANRAHVSIYPVYLAGLSSWSQAKDAANALKDATAASRSESSGGAVQTWGARSSQAGESAITANALEALSNLGKATSGILMGDSNDLATPMQALFSDVGNYYEIAYVPQNSRLDGSYRKIAVKIPKAKTVLARNGYFAVAGEASGAMLPYETALLEVLNQATPPHTFDYMLSLPHFENRNGASHYVMIMEVPLTHFTFAEDPKTKKLQCQFALMAVVKDESGKVVERVSQSYPLEVPSDRLEAYRKSNLLLSRDMRLPQGKYSVEAIAQDKAAGKESVMKVPLEVPASPTGIQVSSLHFIKKVDPVGQGDTDTGNPFRLGDRKVSPFVEDPITLKLGSPARMFLVVYPDSTDTAKPQMELQVFQGGASLGKIPMELPAADAQGRIQYAGTLPTDSFAPGQYELKVVVTQGSSQASARAGLILVQ